VIVRAPLTVVACRPVGARPAASHVDIRGDPAEDVGVGERLAAFTSVVLACVANAALADAVPAVDRRDADPGHRGIAML